MILVALLVVALGVGFVVVTGVATLLRERTGGGDDRHDGERVFGDSLTTAVVAAGVGLAVVVGVLLVLAAGIGIARG